MSAATHPLEQRILDLFKTSTVLSSTDIGPRLRINYKAADYRLGKMLDKGVLQRVCAVRAGSINTSARHFSLPGAQGVALFEGWTAERLKVLHDMHAEDAPYAAIAHALNISVGAVAGKLDRTGAPRRPRLKATRPVPAVPRAPTVKKVSPQVRDGVKPPKTPKAPFLIGNRPNIEAKSPTPIRDHQEAPGLATVLTVGAHMCRWPIGDPASSDFTFCGAKKARGSYCEKHGQVAFKAEQPKPAKRLDDIGFARRRAA